MARSPSCLVRLNIGGHLYTTTRDTILRSPYCPGGGDFFSGLLSGSIPSQHDEQGRFFIDRDGQYFAPLLEYLRTGDLVVPPTLSVTSVYREADFFGVSLAVPRDASTGSLALQLRQLRADSDLRAALAQQVEAKLPIITEQLKSAARAGGVYAQWKWVNSRLGPLENVRSTGSVRHVVEILRAKTDLLIGWERPFLTLSWNEDESRGGLRADPCAQPSSILFSDLIPLASCAGSRAGAAAHPTPQPPQLLQAGHSTPLERSPFRVNPKLGLDKPMETGLMSDPDVVVANPQHFEDGEDAL